MHQYHLAVQDGLKFVNACTQGWFPEMVDSKFRHYVGSLAAISNSWRDQASKVMLEWQRSFGHESLGRQYPSQVIAGRWGSVDAAEMFLLARGQEKVQTVLLRVLSKFIKADPKGTAKAAKDGKDKPDKSVADTGDDNADNADAGGDPTLDAINAFKITLSKWYRTTFHAISSKIFWFLLHICHRARRPLRHFFAFMQKHSTKDCLFSLVTNKITAFKQDSLNLVLSMPMWLQDALNQSGCSNLKSETQCKLKLLGAQLVLKQIRSLDLRILKRLEELLGIWHSIYQ